MKKMIYLVAIDGSEYSDRAAMRAVNLAKMTKAEVHFITIPSPYGIKTREERETPAIVELEQSISDEMFAPLKEKYDNEDVVTNYDIVWGHPADVIHQNAKDKHANMIFVGRRGRSKVLGLLVGSVANSLAHTAGVPIVLVP